MTPAQIETAARRKYNSVSSSFFATAEIYDLIYQAELEIAKLTRVIEVRTVISGGSVDGTQAYALPSTVLELKRVEYDGKFLDRIDLRDDDLITAMDSNSTTEGIPEYYYEWARTIYLRPIPNASSEQIRLYGYGLPAAVTSASQTLEVPDQFHMDIVDFVVAEMAAKDKQFDTANFYMNRWENKHLPNIMAWARKQKTGDKFKVVKDVDSLPNRILGPV